MFASIFNLHNKYISVLSYFIEHKTRAGLSAPPDLPQFAWERIPTEGLPIVKIHWKPNLDGHPGSHFYTKYRVKGESEWLRTDDETQSESQVVRGLEPSTNYEFVVVAVDGDHIRESQVQQLETFSVGK